MRRGFIELDVEKTSLAWLESLEWTISHGTEIAPGELLAERQDYHEPILPQRLRDALAKLNPSIPTEALEDAFRKISHIDAPSLIQSNHLFHRILVDGVDVEYQASGRIKHNKAKLIDFDDPENNDWVAVNQYTVEEGQHNRRPDVVLFVNGLPLGVIELKNPADENASIWSAFHQLQTYKQQIPSLFTFNEVMVISDGNEARIGSLTANGDRFMFWKTIEGEKLATGMSQLEVLIKGVFEKRRFLDYIRHFVVFEEDRGGITAKKLAGYHQFHAVNTAVAETIRASYMEPFEGIRDEKGTYFSRGQEYPAAQPGDKRIGVIWHTQGSGKSLTMAYYAGKIILHPAMENPTLVVITDRNDLDDQLFGTFSRCHELLRQKPVQAESRAHLRELLKVASGGVIFTTIQKFMSEEGQQQGAIPVLSERRNIVVIADEAHRSQYDFIDGYARHMRDSLPNASFVGFTGTPVELADRDTRAVFGDYISVYDIQRAVEDEATVRIYYEGRHATLRLHQEEKPQIDEKFEEITEDEEAERKERLRSKWAALEAVVGSEKRIKVMAEDIVRHFEGRLEALEGKGMIVCMSRRICVELYQAITALRPQWHSEDDAQGSIKIIMTGAPSDDLSWQQHIRSKQRREKLANRFRDPKDHFKLVIVRDMWLTGFDAPSLHTMYIDKPMQGHGLMQAIARVNRVFGDKPGGLVVDYLGLAGQLKNALKDYTESGGEGKPTFDQEEAVKAMQEKYEVCVGLFHGFDWSSWAKGTPEQRLNLLAPAQEHILNQKDGKERLLKAVSQLSQAFALAVPHKKALEIREDVAFFQTVRAALVKTSRPTPRQEEDFQHAVRQLLSWAISSDQVIDLFSAAGLKKPTISILSDEFLAEVKKMPRKNLAVEVLRKLLLDEIKLRAKRNIVQGRSFAEMLERSINAYHNRAIEAVQVIEELIKLAKEMREAHQRGEKLGLSDDELAFYDALETNDSAVKVLGDKTLHTIARELLESVRKNATIDWTVRESVRAKLRVIVKRILRKYGYPPDKQEKATQTVLEQAELICQEVMI